MQDLRHGSRIHGYTLIEFINRGTTAEVWRIEDEFKNVKALKIFSPTHGLQPATLDILIDEFKMLYRLDHPHIIKMEIMGAHERVPYLIMPYYDSSLAGEINRRLWQAKNTGILSSLFAESECFDFLTQISDGLQYLHAQGIVHQDIKPENILFHGHTAPIQYVLTDFGVSTKIKENVARMTLPREQAFALTPAYAAPEQFKGKVSSKSDVFSLGVILYEMTQGRLPFSSRGFVQSIPSNLQIPEFDQAEIQPALRSVIGAMLAPDPDDRPSASEIFQKLTEKEVARTILRQDQLTQIQTLKPGPKENIPPPRFETPASRVFSTESDGGKPRKTFWRKWQILIYAFLLLVILWGIKKVVFPPDQNRFIAEAEFLFRKGKLHEAHEKYAQLYFDLRQTQFLDRQVALKKIIDLHFDQVGILQDGMFRVAKGGKWGFISDKGDGRIECQYANAMDFDHGYAFVCMTPGKNCGLIDKNGQPYTPFKYSGIQKISSRTWKLVRVENETRIEDLINFQ